MRLAAHSYIVNVKIRHYLLDQKSSTITIQYSHSQYSIHTNNVGFTLFFCFFLFGEAFL